RMKRTGTTLGRRMEDHCTGPLGAPASLPAPFFRRMPARMPALPGVRYHPLWRTQDMSGDGTRLPLVPLSDLVHFPRTELRLHVVDPSYLPLLQDLAETDEDSRWLGVVLLKPGWKHGRPEIFPGGTAARVMDLETLPDGRSDLLLYGEIRFELERELGDAPYRQALVRPVEEPWLDERDAGIVAVRQAILELLRSLCEELGDKLPLDVDALAAGDCA